MLCLGYSVTELAGYVEHAQMRAAAEGGAITYLKSGWGGHSLPSIACLIDEILDALPCEGVLLELFTGNVRYFDARTMRRYLDDILAATAKRNLPVAFLNLHQGGVDYADERVGALLAEYRALHAIPYLDLVEPFLAAPDRADLLLDGTHVTPRGAAFYGDRVHAFVLGQGPRLDYAAAFRKLPRRWESLPLRALPAPSCSFELGRNGMPLSFLELREGEHALIPLGRLRSVVGVLVTYGPSGGTMYFSASEGGAARSIVAYDQYAYYTRAVFHPIKLAAVETLRIAQGSGLPGIALRKGEPDLGPRLGRVSHIFCRRALGAGEHLALLGHSLKRALRRPPLRWRRGSAGDEP